MTSVEDLMEGVSAPNQNVSDGRMVAPSEIEECDVSSGDVIPTIQNCKAVWVDTDGDIKVAQKNPANDTESIVIYSVNAKTWNPIPNVIMVYKELKSGTDTTAEFLNNAYVSKIGLKVGR